MPGRAWTYFLRAGPGPEQLLRARADPCRALVCRHGSRPTRQKLGSLSCGCGMRHVYDAILQNSKSFIYYYYYYCYCLNPLKNPMKQLCYSCHAQPGPHEGFCNWYGRGRGWGTGYHLRGVSLCRPTEIRSGAILKHKEH